MHPEFATPPAEKTLGVPVYPGAVYSPEFSAFFSGYSNRAWRRYVYLVDQPIDAVVCFYEAATGGPAVRSPYSSCVYQIPLNPRAAFVVDERVTTDHVMVQAGPGGRTQRIVICRKPS